LLSAKLAALLVATLNCNGLGGKPKRDRIFDILKLNRFDCIFLQETHVNSLAHAQEWERHWGGKAFWSFGTPFSRGVEVLFRPNLSFTQNYFHYDVEGRLLVIDDNINGIDFRLINVYCPNQPRPRRVFLNSLSRFLAGGKRYLIIGGDFNCVGNVTLDKIGGNRTLGEAGGEILADWRPTFNLLDVYRTLYPTSQTTTWFSPTINVGCRLDRFYVATTLVNSVTNITTNPCADSDHCMVAIKFNFKISEPTRGPGYWKCNVNTLSDPYFVDDMVGLWKQCSKFVNKDLAWWENCKRKFKNLIITHSRRISNNHRQTLKDLENRLAFLQRQSFRDLIHRATVASDSC
jgi:exonuclease III